MDMIIMKLFFTFFFFFHFEFKIDEITYISEFNTTLVG